jgi:hypothetical protein
MPVLSLILQAQCALNFTIFTRTSLCRSGVVLGLDVPVRLLIMRGHQDYLQMTIAELASSTHLFQTRCSSCAGHRRCGTHWACDHGLQPTQCLCRGTGRTEHCSGLLKQQLRPHQQQPRLARCRPVWRTLAYETTWDPVQHLIERNDTDIWTDRRLWNEPQRRPKQRHIRVCKPHRLWRGFVVHAVLRCHPYPISITSIKVGGRCGMSKVL